MLAIVLKRVDFHEMDQMITLFTLEKGKKTVLARGVKKIISKNSAYLEPFFLIEMDLIVGRENNYLTQVYGVESFRNIRDNLSKAVEAMNIISVVNKILIEDAAEQNIFYLLVDWLKFLDKTDINVSNFYFRFLCSLLKVLGIKPVLDCCSKCQCSDLLKLNSSSYSFSYKDGGLVCLKCSNKDMENQFAKLTISDIKDFNSLIDQDFNVCPEGISNNLKMVISMFAEYHTGVILDK